MAAAREKEHIVPMSLVCPCVTISDRCRLIRACWPATLQSVLKPGNRYIDKHALAVGRPSRSLLFEETRNIDLFVVPGASQSTNRPALYAHLHEKHHLHSPDDPSTTHHTIPPSISGTAAFAT